MTKELFEEHIKAAKATLTYGGGTPTEQEILALAILNYQAEMNDLLFKRLDGLKVGIQSILNNYEGISGLVINSTEKILNTNKKQFDALFEKLNEIEKKQK